MKRIRPVGLSLLLVLALRASAALAPLPEDSYFAPFKPEAAPAPSGLMLKQGDRLAICGDSITEQKMYSRIMETYLTVCVPQLDITVRQFGWSGERAPGFLGRMTNDVLRFHPTIATTCYGMNDHRYTPYTEEIGREYRDSSEAIIRSFKAHGVRVLQGAAGTVGKMPSWVRSATGTVTDLNLGLMELRNIDIDLARQEQVGFADVYLPMLVEGFHAQNRWGTDYMVSGKDGVHPGWAGQLVMAYAFLKGFGLDGDIGTITVDLAKGTATASEGHRVIESAGGVVQLESSRYPFCATGPEDRDDSIRSGMELVPFNQDLNRLMLVARHGTAAKYRVTWSDQSRIFTAAELAKGVNLARDFAENPFSEAFKQVDEAVGRKQAYETRQIKDLFHGPEGRTDMTLTEELTEEVRTPLARAIARAFKPVKHTLKVEAE
ncbi:MAG: SGNH/GDSL hydrolase family protein [Verrucomicrobiales bacterium]|nr:SGNH/GDSL hydrolase family protein [Verrucomicrobiales bacterium]